jgi:predicted DCC family thiol-disulfide oxidoreductase YuxK
MKPVLVYDGDCEFCRDWVKRAQSLSGSNIEYLPSSEAQKSFPAISPEEFQTAVQFIRKDGSHISGAAAVFELLASFHPCLKILHNAYHRSRLFQSIAEQIYSFIAENRRYLR